MWTRAFCYRLKVLEPQEVGCQEARHLLLDVAPHQEANLQFA